MMNKEEAVKIIEEFIKQGGRLFFDEVKCPMPDEDIISTAKDCKQLMEMRKEKTNGNN